jgi:protein-tyrosine phosphatase
MIAACQGIRGEGSSGEGRRGEDKEGNRGEGSRGEGSRGEGSRGEGSRGEGSRGEGSRGEGYLKSAQEPAPEPAPVRNTQMNTCEYAQETQMMEPSAKRIRTAIPLSAPRSMRSAARAAAPKIQRDQHQHLVSLTTQLYISEDLGPTEFKSLHREQQFNVVSLIRQYKMKKGPTHLCFPLDDDVGMDLQSGLNVASKIHALMKKDPTKMWIVHCLAGVNRASWICALILHLMGHKSQEAIDIITTAKSVCTDWHSFEGKSGQRFRAHVMNL